VAVSALSPTFGVIIDTVSVRGRGFLTAKRGVISRDVGKKSVASWLISFWHSYSPRRVSAIDN